MTLINLTAPGHAGVTLSVHTSALVPEPGAVAIAINGPLDPLTLTLTDDERRALIRALEQRGREAKP